MQLTIEEVVQAVEGIYTGAPEVVISGVEFDSRKIVAGNLFVPLAGARDGHEFIQQAIENGAVATFWSRPVDETLEISVIQVADPLVAMQQLARYYLEKVGAEVVAITGSNGKTTTKDMTEAVLAQKFATYKTQGNYNNNIGLPYTILHMPETTEKLILEMGMDHAGEIEELSLLARPAVAAITMIGEAHIENLGSREGIAKAKMEIVTGLSENGLLVIPSTEPLLTPLVADLPQTIKTFGLHEADVTATIVSEEKTQTIFKIGEQVMTIPVPGSYNVTNALIAYQIGCWFNLSIEQIQTGLANFQLTQNRTQWVKAGNGADILSDVYNANPTAMGLVLDTVRNLETTGNRIAVLADMLELGPDSKMMHASMAEHVDASFAKLFLYGEEMTALKARLSEEQPEMWVELFAKDQKEQLIQSLIQTIQPTDMVVIKGSNGMGLAEVVKELENMK
ncbi:UDP-N-acetylmuramoyl-tripeptide--D-alanyl-D-alanine ligase [Enterococcus sp. JM4C]|uniref:UDP-N-acetylmuramoyl-tripeptide--D-alanyl-D- alanine ligase n=1 Tax=Candidatus Enterococcus huntleyi TaxID=1857217 RepID=UPI001379B026|nr:UDP-N-acetylmuramoyl-tripeptide--D-alanyl-D-alanine ligase [Enterococcus sp. JM4C]KAF1299513.1 UDP-N-acetylmuramoyl-tripeptide--D-alanyl-D-alanine ligase [Enterococcus sp. JM4C]